MVLKLKMVKYAMKEKEIYCVNISKIIICLVKGFFFFRIFLSSLSYCSTSLYGHWNLEKKKMSEKVNEYLKNIDLGTTFRNFL